MLSNTNATANKPSSVRSVVHVFSHRAFHIACTPRKSNNHTEWLCSTSGDASSKTINVDWLVGQISACMIDAAFGDEGFTIRDYGCAVHFWASEVAKHELGICIHS
jgi:hypothetical protein